MSENKQSRGKGSLAGNSSDISTSDLLHNTVVVQAKKVKESNGNSSTGLLNDEFKGPSEIGDLLPTTVEIQTKIPDNHNKRSNKSGESTSSYFDESSDASWLQPPTPTHKSFPSTSTQNNQSLASKITDTDDAFEFASPPYKQAKRLRQTVLLNNTMHDKSTTDNDSFESFAKAHLYDNGNSTAILDGSSEITEASSSKNEEFLPLYSSSTSTDENEINTNINKIRKTKQVKNWQRRCEYGNAEIAKSALEKEDTWSILRKNNAVEGTKYFYRCNKMKLRGPQCAAQVYHLFANDSDLVIEFRTNGNHDHDSRLKEIEYKQRLTEEVERLLNLNQKPNEIMYQLSEIEGLVLPTLKQLKNIIAKLRKKKYGPPTISMQELEKWLREHSLVPNDEHESFVLCYEVNVESDDPYFRLLLTTKHLLLLAAHRNVTHSDTTYKCIWQGFPVFMVGTTDLDKAYHPFALSVCTDEKTPDFEFIFEGIKQGLMRVFGIEKNQTTIVCDAAFAIINAFKEVYGDDVIVIMCWFHAKTAMEEHLTIVKKDNRVELLEDIEFIQLASSPDIFQGATKSFLDKWATEETEYCEYFRSEWIEKHPNWYLGAAEFTPCHNNALEASNRYLKDSNTIRIRHPLPHFLRVASETTHKWSKRYEIGTKSFSLNRTIDMKSWTLGYQWARSNIQAKIIQQDDESLTVLIDAEVVHAKKNNKDGLITHKIIQPEVKSILVEERRNFEDLRNIQSQPIAKSDGNTRGRPKANKVKSNAPAQSQPSVQSASYAQSQSDGNTRGRPKAKKVNSKALAQSQPSVQSVSYAQSQSDGNAQPITQSQPIAKSDGNTRGRPKAKKVKSNAPAQSQPSVQSASYAQSQSDGNTSEMKINSIASVSTPSGQSLGFEKYKQSFLKWTTTISKKTNNLKEGRCNCPAFAKEYVCKHIIGLSIRSKYVVPPPEAKTVPIGQKRKRGRPSKTKPALMVQ